MTQQAKTISTGMLTREFKIRKDSIDEESRSVEFPFSSEEPYLRWFGNEILDHSKSAVNLARIKDGGPLLAQHRTENQIGVIEAARVKDNRAFAKVRFSRSALGEEYFQDILDGIRRNVSVGYSVDEMVLEKQNEQGPDDYRVVKWTPLEVSIVAIPADPTVGIGRADDQHFKTEVFTMPDDTKGKPIDNGSGAPAPQPQTRSDQPEPAQIIGLSEGDAAKREKEAIAAERRRIAEINALAARFNMREQGDKAVGDGTSVDAFRGVILDHVGNTDKPLSVTDPSIGLGKNDIQRFSFMRLLRAQVFKENRQFQEQAAFEFEVSEAAANKLDRAPQGLYVPFDVYVSREVPFLMGRALNVGTAGDGGELVAEDLLSGSFIDVLRNLSLTLAMGARTLSGLVGNVAIPRKTSGSVAGWIATEGGDAGLSEPQFDQVTLTPKTLGAYSQITRNLLLQSSMDVEALVREDLAMAVALEIDRAAIYGTGLTGQPTGITATTGINTLAAHAGTIDWGLIVDLESAVAVDNALLGTLGYMFNAAMRGILKQTEKASGTAQFIMAGNDNCNGYRAGVTNQIAAGDLLFGNFADLLIGFWGALDLIVDPYTGSKSGTLQIVVHQSVDCAVRHPVSFCHVSQT